MTPVTGELAACGYKPCATQRLDLADRKQGFAKVRMDLVIKTAVFGAKVLGLAGVMVVTAFSSEPIEVTYQGWVEANFVFIGPDETGRVEKLSVREGDAVTQILRLKSSPAARLATRVRGSTLVPINE